MNIQVALIDFDYTITTIDTLDLLAKRFNVEAETAELDRLFWEGKLPGLQGLIRRINLLKGLTVSEINDTLGNDDIYRQGAIELFDYFKKHNVTTIIASGNILPALEAANCKLQADYLVCSRPRLVNDAIDSISEADYSGDGFKLNDSRAILKELGIRNDSVIAIGDSPADKSLLEYAKVSFVVDPKNGVKKNATYVIDDNLADIIPILEQIQKMDWLLERYTRHRHWGHTRLISNIRQLQYRLPHDTKAKSIWYFTGATKKLAASLMG